MSYYIVDDTSNQQGPYSESEIQAFIQSRVIHENTLCWKEGFPQWVPVKTALPTFFTSYNSQVPPGPVYQQAYAPPAAAPSYGQAVQFEIIKKEYYQMPKITLNNQEVIIEAGLMHYMQGQIEIEAKMPSVGNMIKAKLTKEKAVRPRYRGTGVVFLEPTFGECNIMELQGEEWILDKGCFMACEPQISIAMVTNKALSGFFGGEGFFQTSVSGHGKVLFSSQGPLETIHLNNDVLTVDGSFAVARTSSLEFSPEKATKKMFGSWISGEGIVNRFRGTGTVMIAPFPNRFLTMLREFGGLHYAIKSIPKGG